MQQHGKGILGQECVPEAPIPYQVVVADHSGGGLTQYSPPLKFIDPNDRVSFWRVQVAGTEKALMENAIPHEMLHVITSLHFNGSSPRWANEGLATLMEGVEFQRIMHDYMSRLNLAGRMMATKELWPMMKDPPDNALVYVQGFSNVKYLLDNASSKCGDTGGMKYYRFLQFLDDAKGVNEWSTLGDWDRSLWDHYCIKDTETFNRDWLRWLAAK